MAGTTYQDLNNLISNIRESGYLEGRWTTDQNPAAGDSDQQVDQEDDEEEEEEEEEEVADNGTEANGHHTESNQKMLGQSPTNSPDEPAAVFPKSVSGKPSQGTPETVPASSPVKQEPSFNFLQESQIDLESPHMDPAVVMVHPAKRPVQPPGISCDLNIYCEALELTGRPHL